MTDALVSPLLQGVLIPEQDGRMKTVAWVQAGLRLKAWLLNTIKVRASYFELSVTELVIGPICGSHMRWSPIMKSLMPWRYRHGGEEFD